MSNCRDCRDYDVILKLLLLGNQGVGKSCIMLRFSDDAFRSTYISTVGLDLRVKTMNVDGKRVRVQIWDTAGQERFQTITKLYYRGAKGIILVYDITNQESFESLTKWLWSIEGCADDDVEKILVGNKTDIETKRVVGAEEGAMMAQNYEMKFLETSAKANINIDAAFRGLVEAILRKSSCRGADQATAPGKVNVRLSCAKTKLKGKCCK